MSLPARLSADFTRNSETVTCISNIGQIKILLEAESHLNYSRFKNTLNKLIHVVSIAKTYNFYNKQELSYKITD